MNNFAQMISMMDMGNTGPPQADPIVIESLEEVKGSNEECAVCKEV